MKQQLIKGLVLTASLLALPVLASNCEVEKWSQTKQQKFVENNFPATELSKGALGLVSCLASQDPFIRDDIAYMAFTKWLRGGVLDTNQILSLHGQLKADIANKKNDANQVYLPFAILVFGEVMRVDRVSPTYSEEQLSETVELVAKTMKQTDDYRGFEDGLGWRHQVAHTSDVVLQLVLNKRLSKTQLDRLVDSLLSQVSPEDHKYTFGESKRLAMPLVYTWLSGQHNIEEAKSWFANVTNPAPMKNWGESYKSESALTKRHNTRQFLLELFTLVASNDHERLNQLEPLIKEALRTIN